MRPIPQIGRKKNPKNIKYKNDYNSDLKQVEVKCANCDAHLGHVFNDGPPPNFKRY